MDADAVINNSYQKRGWVWTLKTHRIYAPDLLSFIIYSTNDNNWPVQFLM